MLTGKALALGLMKSVIWWLILIVACVDLYRRCLCRLMNMCSSFVEELGEEEIYEIYRRDPSDSKAFEKALCKGSGIFGTCSKVQERRKSEL